MACQIIYKDGKVDKVLTPSGSESVLYPQLVELVKDNPKYAAGKTALDLYQHIYTPEFEIWRTNLLESEDQEEPTINMVDGKPIYGDLSYGRSVFDQGMFKDQDQNLYYNIDAQDGSLDPIVRSKVMNFFTKNGFKVEQVDEILAGSGVTASVDMLNHVVRFIDGKAANLPEEAAHILLKMLPAGSPLLNDMLSKASGFKTYNKILETYSILPAYQNADGTPNLSKVAEETVAQVIAGVITGRSAENKAKTDQARSFLGRIIRFLRRMLTGKSREFESTIDPFARAANMILNGYTAEVPLLDETYYHADAPSQQAVIDSIKSKADTISDEKVDKKYQTKDGQVFTYRVSDMVKKVREKLFRLSEGLSDKQLSFIADKGTVIHYYMQTLMHEDVSRKQLVDRAFKEVNNELDTKRSKEFMDITTEQYNEIKSSINSFKKVITDEDPGAVILTEQTVFSKDRDLAGTIDVLVVHSDGQVSIYDYKTIQNLTRKQDISRQSFMLYERQLGEYKRILLEEYPVKGVRKSRILPIAVSFEGDTYKHVTVGTLTSKQEYLRPLPVAGELTDDENINRTLSRMLRRREALGKRLDIEKSDQLRIEYAAIDRAIKTLQRSGDYTGIIQDLISTSNYVLNNIENFTIDDVGSMNQYLSHFDLYEDFIADFGDDLEDFREQMQQAGYKKEITTELNKIRKAVTDSIMARSAIINKLVEVNEEHFDSQLTDGGRVMSAAGAMLFGRDNYNNPVFRAYHSIINVNEERTRRDLDNVIAKISEADANLKKKYSGIKGFEFMIEDNQLIRPYNKDFTDDRKYYQSLYKDAYNTIQDNPNKKNASAKADMAKAVAWAKQNLMFDEELYNKRYEEFNQSISDPLSGLDTKQAIQARAKYQKNNPNNDAGAWFSSRFVRVDVEKLDSKYKSDKWERAQSIPEVKDYLDAYLEIMRELRDVTGNRFNSVFFLPAVEKSIVEALKTGGIKPVDYVTQIYDVQEQDETRGVADEQGNPIKSIPLLYSRPLIGPISNKELAEIDAQLADGSQYTREELVRQKRIENGKSMVSKDLTQSLILFASSAYTYKHNTESVDLVKGLRHIMNNRQYVQQTDRFGRLVRHETTGELISTKASDTNTISQYDFFVDRDFYGIRQTSKDKMIKLGNSRQISAIKGVNGLQNLMTATRMGLNPILATSNFIYSRANTIFRASEGTHYNRDQVKFAIKGYTEKDPAAVGAITLFQTDSRGDTYEKVYKNTSLRAEKLFSMRTLMNMHKIGDDHIKRTITVAMTNNYVFDDDMKIRSKTGFRVQNENAPTIASLIKQDNDGNYFIDYKSVHPKMTKAQFELEYTRFRAIINKEINRVSGALTEDQKGQAHSHIAGQLLLKFKTWMTSQIQERAGNITVDPLSQEFEVGRFRIFVGEVIGNGLLSTATNLLKELARAASFGLFKPGYSEERARAMFDKVKKANPDLDITFDQYMKLRIAKLNSMGLELRTFLALLTAMQLAAASEWDDEENSFFTRFAYTNLQRAYLELSFFFNPNSALQFFKSPVPVVGILEDIRRMASNFLIEGGELAGILPDNPRDKSPLGYYALKQIPGVNQVLKATGYFDQFNRKYFIDYILPK